MRAKSRVVELRVMVAVVAGGADEVLIVAEVEVNLGEEDEDEDDDEVADEGVVDEVDEVDIDDEIDADDEVEEENEESVWVVAELSWTIPFDVAATVAPVFWVDVSATPGLDSTACDDATTDVGSGTILPVPTVKNARPANFHFFPYVLLLIACPSNVTNAFSLAHDRFAAFSRAEISVPWTSNEKLACAPAMRRGIASPIVTLL